MAQVQPSQTRIDKSYDTGTYSGTYDEIKNEFNQLNPAPINVACTAWSRLAGQLGTVANELMAKAGHPLHEVWESKTSPDAQQQLQLAQATAQALADQCMQMARATDWAYQYAQWYKDHVPGDGLITTSSDADAINNHRVALLDRYNEVIGYCIPSQVQTSLVQNQQGAVSNFHATPGPGPAGPGPMGPGPGPGPGPVSTLPPPHIPPPHIPPPHVPGPPHTPGPPPYTPGPPGTPGPGWPGPGPGPIGPGPGSGYNPNALPTLDNSSALAGFDPSGGGAGSFGAGGASGLGAGGASGLGGGLGAGGLGAADASGLAGSGAGMGAGSGSGGGVGGVGAAGGTAGGAGGRPGTMMPMHGSGQNGDDEHERSTWLAEDDDIWGADDAPPGVIGG